MDHNHFVAVFGNAGRTGRPLGPELVTNGNFSAGTGTDADNWAEQAGAERTDAGGGQYVMRLVQPTFAGGLACRQAGILTIGVTYQVQVKISNYTAGSIKMRAGTAYGSAITANGTYTEDITCAGNTNLDINEILGTGDLDIDDVSVKAVL